MLKDNPETVSRMLDFLLSQPERTLKPRTSLKSPGPQPEIPADPPGPTVSEDIVEALNYAAGPVGISELARKTGRSKAGVHQMVHTMAGRGEVVLTPNGYELPT